MKPLPPLSLLLERFEFDVEAGTAVWRARGRPSFDGQWAGRRAFVTMEKGYLRGHVQGFGNYRAHRVFWYVATGEPPFGEIDHVNGDRADNRLCNLRVVTSQENRRNAARSGRNTSGVIGVSYDRRARKWRAAICVNYQVIELGHFAVKADAAAARKQAERKYGFHPNHGRTRRTDAANRRKQSGPEKSLELRG